MKLEASEIEFCPTVKLGTAFESVSSMFEVVCAASSSPDSTSMEAADSSTVRPSRRVPVTTVSSILPAPPAVADFWGPVLALCDCATDAASSEPKTRLNVDIRFIRPTPQPECDVRS